MENASSPQEAIAVPTAMMETAMVTCARAGAHAGWGVRVRCGSACGRGGTALRTGVDSLSRRAATRMTMVITGVAAFRIWMKETERYRYARLPKPSVAA